MKIRKLGVGKDHDIVFPGGTKNLIDDFRIIERRPEQGTQNYRFSMGKTGYITFRMKVVLVRVVGN